MLYNSIDRKNVLNCCSLFLNVRKLYKSEKKSFTKTRYRTSVSRSSKQTNGQQLDL